MKVLIMGMGAIGHTYAALASDETQVDLLTSTGDSVYEISNTDGDSHLISNCYSYENIEVIDHDFLLVTLPYRQKISRLNQIKNIISKDTTIVIIPGNQGAYYYLPKELRDHKIILTERVIQIARLVNKYELVKVFGKRLNMHMSELNGASIDKFISIYPLHGDVVKHSNHEDISLITSNATIHTPRVYEMFGLKKSYNKEFLFYEHWSDIASQYFIDLENEMFEIAKCIEQDKNISLDIYDMFTHFKISPVNEKTVTDKIRNFPGFRGITFFVADKEDLINNRYLIDDCIIGMSFYIELGNRYNVDVKTFKLIHNWALSLIDEEIEELKYMQID